MKEYIFKLGLMFLVPLLTSLLLTPYMAKLAYHIKALDVPRTRHIHKTVMPKLGGLAVFWAFMFGYLLFGGYSKSFLGIITGGFIILLTGIVDDINPIGYKLKFMGEIIAALVLIFFGNLLLTEVSLFGYTINFGYFSYLITLFFILACTNIINLIDGLDGLASGVSAIFFFTITVIAFFQNRFGTLEITLSIMMLGGILGFLKYNFNPAKIFLGDSGALFIGYMVSVVSLLGFKQTLITSIAVPLLLLAIPVLDTLFSIIRRVLKHQSPFEADADHLHHQLLKFNLSQKKTVVIIYIVDLLFSVTSIFYTLKDKKLGTIVYLSLILLVLWFVFNTDVISKRINKRKK